MSTDFRQQDGPRAARERELAARDREAAELERRHAAALLASACRDDLTGTLTRRAGRERLRAEIIRAQRSGTALCVAFLDVDGLKRVNDERGHAGGDEILAAVGIALRECLRAYDSIIRYGGDEFVCVVPGVDERAAAAAVDRARRRASALSPGTSFSAGYALLRRGDDLDDVIQRADADMYEHKRMPNRGPRGRSSQRAMPKATGPRLRSGDPAVACGQCGGRIALADFNGLADDVATRLADCGRCGATTVIRLSQPRSCD